jgi:hypothetical protein
MFSEGLKPVAIAESEQEGSGPAHMNATGGLMDGEQNQSTPQLAGGPRQASQESQYMVKDL